MPASKQHEMTHVLQVATDGQFEMAAGQRLDAGSAWSATHVSSAPEVVLLVSRNATTSTAQYSVDTNLPSVHVLVGLPRNRRFRVKTPIGEQFLVSDTQGILAFEDPTVGLHSLRLTEE